MKKLGKKLCVSFLSLMLVCSSIGVLPISAATSSKNLITNSTPIALLRPDKDITDISQVWSWKDGVLTSLDKNREDSNAVFQIDGLDNTKTYRYAGKLKLLEFGADTGWYGPRIIFRGKNREDIENCDYSALCHMQNTEVFINNFINAATLPYEVTNVRAKINTEIPFEIYVSPEKTLVYYGGKQCFYVDNSSRVQKLPLSFGFWSIGCKAQYYDLSLTEATMPVIESPESSTIPPKNSSITSPVGNNSKPPASVSSNAGVSSNGDKTSSQTDIGTSSTLSTETITSSDEQIDSSNADTPAGIVSEKNDNEGSQSSGVSWPIVIVIIIIVLLAAAAILFYVLVIHKKKTQM